jgi:hypothetical protein
MYITVVKCIKYPEDIHNDPIVYDSLEKLENDCKIYKNIHLWFISDEIHKLFLDIDYYYINDYINKKTYIYSYILKIFKNYDISIAESNKEKKISYHIIINNYKIKISDMPLYIENYIKPKFMCDIIDTTIYVRNTSCGMRLPYCSKPGEYRPLNIIKGKFEDFITSLCDKSTLIEYKRPIKKMPLFKKELKNFM